MGKFIFTFVLRREGEVETFLLDISMKKINDLLRIPLNKKNRKRLHVQNVTLICSNCYGAIILHDLGLKFCSPFVNLWMKPKDFLKYLENINYYMNIPLTFVKEENIDYPVGKLDDIYIYFQHYKTEEEAKSKWEQRNKRMDLDNLFIMFSERDGCTYEDLLRFDKLPYENKIVFTHIPYKEIKSSFYIKGFEKQNSVGHLYKFINKFSGQKYLDQFDYVSWLNNSKKNNDK